ncbi:hypothetical protein [Spartinivicinus ruber]|uniref:hypothetical protein n=1 Tax=Spartinivicinus ruber TaxID=2683272 RepID=UPI0013D1DFD2|nr:hypothetical protein [Spartinivicinus ruber]
MKLNTNRLSEAANHQDAFAFSYSISLFFAPRYLRLRKGNLHYRKRGNAMGTANM